MAFPGLLDPTPHPTGPLDLEETGQGGEGAEEGVTEFGDTSALLGGPPYPCDLFLVILREPRVAGRGGPLTGGGTLKRKLI